MSYRRAAEAEYGYSIMAFWKISELNITKPETWPQYKVRFSFFAGANKITDTKQLRATFLTVIGEPALALLTSLITPKELVDVSYEELIQVLDSHFDPKKNEVASCFVFANRKQQPTETIAEFMGELKQFSRGSNFQDLEKQLLIQLNLTFDKAVKISATFEAANRNEETISVAQNEVEHFYEGSCNKLENVQEESGYVGSTKNAKRQVSTVRNDAAITCFRCGVVGHKAPECRHRNTICSRCHKVGHIKRVCRSSSSTQGTKAEKSEVYYTDSGRVSREHTRVNEDHYGTLFNKFIVADSAGKSLLGRNWFEDLGISIQGIRIIEDDNSILKDYEPLSHEEGLPSLKVPPVHIKLKTDAEPKILKARSAILLHTSVHEALDMLVKEGVLEPTTFSSWATPVVPVFKKMEAYQNVFPFPTIKELLVNLGCSEVFSQLDVKQAYFQLPVDDATAEILTLSTSKGLMCVLGLPQVLSASPGIFQNFMEQLLSGFQGIAVFLDDIVIARSSVAQND
ncbi:hypothetical protein PR048_010480 [Dryococelus australis]|uniref:Uncharacterized protein n=1 Tax=Dryococelus australis TaxID=614101 RepID=A0ABQ9I2W0_9NEOP|nr:hypothetical protein PR048_010480 [Dryococelus australis]